MPGSKRAGPSTLAGTSLLLRNNIPEQNTEQKSILSFPYKTLPLASEARLQTNGSARLSLRPARVPRRDLPLAFQGILPPRALPQSSVPSPRCPPQAWFSGCSQSPLQFEVFWFRLFFLACQSEPGNTGCKAGQPSAVLCTLPFPHR